MMTTPAHTASAAASVQAVATNYVQMEDGSGHGYVNCVGNGNGYIHDGALAPRQQQTLQSGGLVRFDSAVLDQAWDEAHCHAGIKGIDGLEAGTTCADDENPSDDDDDDEQQHTLHPDPSILSSVVTADGISDPVGFHIVCLVGLIGDMGRGCMFPTLWPLVQSIGGNSMTLGHALAAFSFGRILMSPVLGSWSHRYGYTRTLALSLAIVLLGTLLYAQVVSVGVGRAEHLLMLAQLVLGLGSGTIGVTRAFVADVTPIRNRTTYMAWLAAVQYAGFTVTPTIGAAFAHFFSQGGRGIDTG